jgi:tetratricopeptide (TPR) repeat protein
MKNSALFSPLRAGSLLIAAGLLAYSNSLFTPLQFDDLGYLADKDLGLDNRPTIALSFALNEALGGTLLVFHTWNLAVHLLAGLTLFGLVRRTLLLPRLHAECAPSATGLALAVSLLWLVHPLLTSAVTYVIQRCESMMGLCFLFCHYALARGSQSSRGAHWYAAGVLVGILGSGCKEVMAVAPLTLLLYDRTFLAESWREVLRRRGPVHLALLLLLVFPVWTSLPYFRSTNIAASVGFSVSAITPWQYLLTEPSVLVHYLRLALMPAPLSFSYRDWPIAHGLADSLPYALPIVSLLAVVGLGVYRARWWGFLGAWFFVILAPTSSFIPIADVCLEYRMYLPLAAVVTLVVVAAWQLLKRTLRPAWVQGASAALVAVAAALLATLTYERNQVYRSSVTLWQDTVDKRPNDLMAHLNLGYSYLRIGDSKSAERVFRDSFNLPGNPRVFLNTYNLGAILANRGDIDRGLPLLQEAHRIDPGDPLAPIYLGVVDYLQGRTDAALLRLEQVRKQHPQNAPVHFLLALVLEEALPGDAAQQARARDLLQRGHQLDPTMADRLRAAAIAEIDAEFDASKPFLVAKTLLDAKLAHVATGRRDPEVLFALGQAYERAGDKDRARTTYEAALAATSATTPDLARRIRERLVNR